MRRPLPELLHDLANRMQAASSAAALLHPDAPDPSAEAALRRLLDELQAAVTIVQTMCRELDAADDSRERSA